MPHFFVFYYLVVCLGLIEIFSKEIFKILTLFD
jgi:hypothetical protein